MSGVDAETPVNWPTGVDVKPPVAESHLVALIRRRPDSRHGSFVAGQSVNSMCFAWAQAAVCRIR